jgi:MFS family permease
VHIFYGWIIVAVTFVTWTVSSGPRQAFSMFLLALIGEFGWSRTQASAAFSVHMASYALGGWALGVAMDRVGPRRVMIYSTVAWALTLVACGRIGTLWHLYVLFGVLGGAAVSGLSYVPNNALLSRWFIRYRGLAAGLSQSGVPLSGAVFGPLCQMAIAVLGWRSTYVALGILIGAVELPLVIFFLRDQPRDMGLRPDGVAPTASPNQTDDADNRRRTQTLARPGLPPGYWTLFLANILRGMTQNAILVHQVAFLVDVGFEKMTAAALFSMSALVAMVSGFVTGALSDRIGRYRAYGAIAVLYVLGTVGLLAVRHPSQLTLVYTSLLAVGIAIGGSGPVFAALLTDLFHGSRFGFLIGLQNIGYGGGATLGPVLAGFLFDRLGNYTLAFLVLAASIGLSSAIAPWSRRRSTRRG